MKEQLKQPPSVAAHAHVKHAPRLSRIFVGQHWHEELSHEARELQKWGEIAPALGLPVGSDPAMYDWPVKERYVVIYGLLPKLRLLRLMGALLRDGALAVAALDSDGILHRSSAHSTTAKEAA